MFLAHRDLQADLREITDHLQDVCRRRDTSRLCQETLIHSERMHDRLADRLCKRSAAILQLTLREPSLLI